MRIKLSQCLVAILVLALLFGLIGNEIRHRREMRELQQSFRHASEIMDCIAYGDANLRLLGINPRVWEHPDCSQYFKHELAMSVMTYWRYQEDIDRLTETPSYSLEFACEALDWLECQNLSEFVVFAETKAVIYPDDELELSLFELSKSERASLDEFIREAVSRASE